MELKDLLKEWARTWLFEDRAFTLSAVEEELHEMGVELDSGELRRAWRETISDLLSPGVFNAVEDVIITAYPEFITLVHSLHTRLPGGDIFGGPSTREIPLMGWNELKILSRLLSAIQDHEDVYLSLSMLETGEDVLE